MLGINKQKFLLKRCEEKYKALHNGSKNVSEVCVAKGLDSLTGYLTQIKKKT